MLPACCVPGGPGVAARVLTSRLSMAAAFSIGLWHIVEY
jgi:hypothetical protein